MTKQATKKPEPKPQTLPAVQNAELDADVAALAAEASDLTDDIRVGDDLKFRKGKWGKEIDGDNGVIKVGATTSFVVDMRSYKRGWIKWIDRKPVFKAIRRPIDGFVSPARDRLPDRDKSQWPRNAQGVPQDP